MKLKTIAAGLFLCFRSLLEGQISAPQPGFARYPDGSIASVFGLPGNFVLRKSPFAPAEAASFSDSGGLVSRAGLILLFGTDGSIQGQYDAQEMTPLLSITGDLSTAVAWLPSCQTLLRWTGTNFLSVQVGGALPSGVVTSLSAGPGKQARFLITQANHAVLKCVVSLENGNVLSCDLLPGVKGPAFEQQGFIVFEDDRGLEAQDQRGAIHTLRATANDLEFQRMSSSWLHLYSARTGQHWALRLKEQDVNLSLLPAGNPAQEDAK